jgi:heptosyltransferase-2
MNLIKNENISKILVVRLSSMGDVILTTALVRQLRKQYPDAQIDYAAAGSFTDALRHNPRISNVFQYDKSMALSEIITARNEFLKSVNVKRYDVIIDLQNNLRSKHFSRGIYKYYYALDKRRLFKLALVHFKKIIRPPAHITDMYMAAAAPLGVSDDGDGLELWLPAEKHSEVYPPARKEFPSVPRKIALAPAAHHYTKRWPADRYAALADMLAAKYDAEIALFGGPADREICLFISSIAKTDIADYSGAATITETAAKLDEFDLLITNDTGVMHIGAARRLPVIAIFGSTVPELGFSPWRTRSAVVENDMTCRPCTHIGRPVCPKGHFECMMNISPEEIMAAAEDIFAKEK